MFAVGSNRLRIAALTASLLMIAAAVGASQSADASPEGRSAARVAAPASIAPVTSCAALQGLDLSRVDTSIASAGEVTRAGHQYCSITGYISPQTRFEVLLPTSTWTGDYLQQGCGSFCGHVTFLDFGPQYFPPSIKG